MAEQSKVTLKGYFNTGDTPTEAQFADLVDSFKQASEVDSADSANAAAAAAAQSTADGKIALSDLKTFGATLANEIVVDNYEKYYTRAEGGTWAFTMGAGNVDQGWFKFEVNVPTALSFSADFINTNATAVDLTKLVQVVGYYSQTDDKMYYALLNLPAVTGPDVTAPTLTGDPVTNIAGTETTLTYDEALDEASTPANGDFVFSPVKAISGVVVSGSTVVITHAAFANGDVITLNYTAGVNPIRDTATTPNNAANLSGQAVTNNVPASGSVAVFNGTTSEMLLPDVTALDIATGGADRVLTIIADVELTEATTARVISKGSAAVTDAFFGTNATDILTGAVYDGALTARKMRTGSVILNGTRAYIIWRYDLSLINNEVRQTIDNVADNINVPNSGTYVVNEDRGPWRIGKAPSDLGGAFSGKIYELAFYIGTLFDDTQMTEAYNSGTPIDLLTHSAGAPTAYYKFNGDLTDSSGNGHDASGTDVTFE